MLALNQGEYGFKEFDSVEFEAVDASGSEDAEKWLNSDSDVSVDEELDSGSESVLKYKAFYSKFTDDEGNEQELRFGLYIDDNQAKPFLYVNGLEYASNIVVERTYIATDGNEYNESIQSYQDIEKSDVAECLSEMPQPFLKLKPGTIVNFFGADSDAATNVKEFYKKQEPLLQNRLRLNANIEASASLIAGYLFQRGYFNPLAESIASYIWKDGYCLRYIASQRDTVKMFASLPQLIVVCFAATYTATKLIEKTSLGGALEYYYNKSTTAIRNNIEHYIGDKACLIPQLDSIVRFGLNYASSYYSPNPMKSDELSKFMAAFSVAVTPYHEKRESDVRYGEDDDNALKVQAQLYNCLGSIYTSSPSLKTVLEFGKAYPVALMFTDKMMYSIPLAIIAAGMQAIKEEPVEALGV